MLLNCFKIWKHDTHLMGSYHTHEKGQLSLFSWNMCRLKKMGPKRLLTGTSVLLQWFLPVVRESWLNGPHAQAAGPVVCPHEEAEVGSRAQSWRHTPVRQVVSPSEMYVPPSKRAPVRTNGHSCAHPAFLPRLPQHLGKLCACCPPLCPCWASFRGTHVVVLFLTYSVLNMDWP